MKQKNLKISASTLFVYKTVSNKKNKAAKSTDVTVTNTNQTTTSLAC